MHFNKLKAINNAVAVDYKIRRERALDGNVSG